MRLLLKILVALFAVFLDGMSAAQATIEEVVDNLDDATSQIGSWPESSAAAEYEKSSFYDNDSKARFTWFPALPQAGAYRVEVIWSYHPNRSTSVPYCITDADGSYCQQFNQRDPKAAQQWTPLGDKPFNCQGQDCQVTVSAEYGQASADAVRWTLVSPPLPPGLAGLAGPVDGAFDGVTPDQYCDRAFKGSRAALSFPQILPLVKQIVFENTCTPRQVEDSDPDYCPDFNVPNFPDDFPNTLSYFTPYIWIDKNVDGPLLALLSYVNDSCANWTTNSSSEAAEAARMRRFDNQNLLPGDDTNAFGLSYDNPAACDNEYYVACYIPDDKK